MSPQNIRARLPLPGVAGRVVRLSPPVRYGAAVAAAAVATLLQAALQSLWGARYPFILFYPAIMVSAWLGGLWPGIVTTLLSAQAAEYFWIDPGHLTVTKPGDLLALFGFVVIGILISALNEAWRRGTGNVMQSEARLRDLQVVTETALANLDSAELMRELLARVRTVLRADEAKILLLQADGASLKPVAFAGVAEELSEDIDIPIGRGVAGRIAESTDGVIIHDLRDVEVMSPRLRERVKSVVGAPLKVGSRLVGVIQAGAAAPHRFNEFDRQLLALVAQRVVIAIERARSNETEHRLRVEAETAARQLQLAVEAGRMGTWQWTISTGEVRWSSGLEAIHGLAPGSFPGTFEAFRNEIHPDDRDRVLRATREAAEQRRDHHIEYRIVRADGSVRWVEGRGQLFLGADGQPLRMVGVCLDVTERKQTEERFYLAVEAAPTAMIMVDQRGRIVFVNALTETLLGYGRRELIGVPIDNLVPDRFRTHHGEYRHAFAADPRQRTMGAGRDLFAVRKDGTEVPVEIGLSPLQTADGLFVLAAVTDITERKQFEEERERLLVREQTARAETERASRLKDEFLAVLSHELRTPLNAVLGYAHLLGTGTLSRDRSRHALEAIQRNAHAQARLVESLLDLSRIIAGKLELDLKPISLSKMIDGAVDVIRQEVDTKGLKLDVQLPDQDVLLVGDGGRLQQVFWNLLSNAVKFTPRGGRIEVRATEHEDSHVRVQVSDSGHGISPDFLPHVFDRFKQAANHGPSPAGLGLGLAVVREMVQAHGGTVIAESAGEGRGSTFTVTLPLTPTTLGPAASLSDSQLEKDVESLRGVDIVVVDDEPDARDLLTLLLESRGAAVRAASSAAEALLAIAERRPDVLLADLRMPDEDGYSLIQRVRAREREGKILRLPAIAVTAYASTSDRDSALGAGYDWHLAKPVGPEALARAIARFTKTENV